MIRNPGETPHKMLINISALVGSVAFLAACGTGINPKYGEIAPGSSVQASNDLGRGHLTPKELSVVQVCEMGPAPDEHTVKFTRDTSMIIGNQVYDAAASLPKATSNQALDPDYAIKLCNFAVMSDDKFDSAEEQNGKTVRVWRSKNPLTKENILYGFAGQIPSHEAE